MVHSNELSFEKEKAWLTDRLVSTPIHGSLSDSGERWGDIAWASVHLPKWKGSGHFSMETVLSLGLWICKWGSLIHTQKGPLSPSIPYGPKLARRATLHCNRTYKNRSPALGGRCSSSQQESIAWIWKLIVYDGLHISGSIFIHLEDYVLMGRALCNALCDVSH